MADAVPTVVVTGATGFVASELVKQLLEKGYTVRGTIRSLQNESKVQHLRRLDQALPGSLTLHEADLLEVCALLHH
jgi:GDP-D-mannose dehydratase